MPGLSVIIITLNEEANILRTLESVRPVADEIVVVDSMSADRTAEICREFGCRVFLRKFDGYGSQRNFSVDKAGNDWLMYVDADEVVTPELQAELLRIFSKGNKPGENPDGSTKKTTDLSRVSGFMVRSSLCYMGRILRYGGVGKEWHLRVFNKKMGRFTDVPVHEGVEVRGEVVNLKGKVIHYSYRGLTHHLDKINHYTTLASEDYISRGKRFPACWVALKFPVTFFSFYFLKGGFLDGYPGFMWSFLAAVYGVLKTAKAREFSARG